MGDTKEIMIDLPNRLLEEVNSLLPVKQSSRSQFIKEIMELYTIEQRRRLNIREKMKQGYREMSQINISLSEIGLAEDIRELTLYEMNLTGCEKQ